LSIRRRIAVLSAASIVALALALVALGGQAQNQTLFPFVGTNDGFDIGITDANGNAVTRVEPGTYTFVVRDRSTQHNFHFASNEDRTVDFRTELAFVGEQSFTVTLRPGTEYAYACEPHWEVMNGKFLVTDTPVAPPPPPPPPLRTLNATVSAKGAVRLSASSVASGRYRIVVNDRSPKANFHLAGRGVNARTGMRFRGSRTLRVTLTKGSYRFGSDSGGLTKRLHVR
jgi:plastocyanin